ncbi:MAG TPA: divalent-cation tolerance protein CutA [Pyrinomonadaceae bacterium]|nr:divalent-cation tolerance protein CutA [Pyrinomonadaceae bacterium]
MLIVFTTVPNAEEAESLAEAIVRARLAACVQIVPQMISFYEWEGNLEKQPEILLIIKTAPDRYDKLEAFIKANHSYSVPEVTAVDAARASAEYLSWMIKVLDT